MIEKMVGFRTLYNNIYRENDKESREKRTKRGLQIGEENQ